MNAASLTTGPSDVGLSTLPELNIRKRGRVSKHAESPHQHPGGPGDQPQNHFAFQQQPGPGNMAPPQQQSPQTGGDNQYQHDVKRPRGRPPGSKNKIIKSGPPLIPHVVLVNSGEDVVDKLREIARSYKRSVVVLAATGTLATATLMQVGAHGQGVGVTLRGQFTILSISGAILQQPASDNEVKVKGKEPNLFLSASLANPTGGVVGGTVAGVLEASGPVTVVIGHWDSARERQDGDQEASTQVPQLSLPGISGPPPSNAMMPQAWMGQPQSEQEDQ